MTHKVKTIATYVIALVALVISASLVIAWIYSQRFVQDSTNTATQGILLQTTLNLVEYKNVSSGNDMLGRFDRYTRSDRHNDVITVYCNDYCKGK